MRKLKGEEVVGGRHRVKVVKNKVLPLSGTTEFDLIYGEGISREGELLALGEKSQFIKKSGASYSYLPPGGDESTEVKLDADMMQPELLFEKIVNYKKSSYSTFGKLSKKRLLNHNTELNLS